MNRNKRISMLPDYEHVEVAQTDFLYVQIDGV